MAEAPQLTVPSDLARLLEAAIASGEYPSADAALADAIALWMRRHEDTAEDLARLKASIKASMSDPRPSHSMSEVRAHMKAVVANAKTRPNEAA